MRIFSKLTLLGTASALVGALVVMAPIWIAGQESDDARLVKYPRDVETPTTTSRLTSPTQATDVSTAFQERHTVLSFAAGVASWEVLLAEIQAWASRSPGSRRAFALEALLTRAFEAFPDRALALALDLDIDSHLLSRIFRSWAEVNAELVLSFLRETDDAWTERQLALAVLQSSSNSAEMLDRLIEAGRSLDVASLHTAYAAWLAESGDEVRAIDEALSLGTKDARRLALEHVARASSDSAALYALARSVEDVRLRQAFLSEINKQWARNDVLGFIEYLKDADSRDPLMLSTVSSGLLFAAEFAPEHTLALASALNEPLRSAARSVSLEAIAAKNPQAALDHLRSIADRRQRLDLLDAVAVGYARYDPEGALTWLSTLEESEAAIAVSSVLAGIAELDLARAIDLRLNGLGSPSVTWLDIPLRSDLDNPAYLAERVFSGDDNAMLSALMSRWAVSEPDDAIAWLRSKNQVPAQTISSVAQDVLRFHGIQAAFDYARLLSTDQQSTWIQAAAFAGAGYDAEGTIQALRTFQRETFYHQALSAVFASTASVQGPRRAAELAGSAPSAQAATVIGYRWADESPPDAAAWALALPDSAARTAAAETVAEVWAQSDPDSTSIWIDGLTDADLRARVLQRVCLQYPEVSACG